MLLELLLSAAFMCTECIEITDPVPPDTTLCASPLSFSGGTLWKPRGENNPNLVVLLAPQHDYEECQVKRRDGTWETMSFTGFSNPDRPTYRATAPGGSTYANKKNGGGVRCFSGPSECFFPLPGAPKNRWE